MKSVDPNARIHGPALYGFGAYLDLQSAPDWPDVQGDYDWFVDYYLDRMQEAEHEEGMRLLDTLDLHWYPEARGGGQRIVFSGTGNEETVEARLQAPRTLWDPTYQEDSWIAQWFSDYLPLLPRLKQSIDTYYPGTKLAISEYSYGAEDHISGGIAQADVLGIFGAYGVDAATHWQMSGPSDYVGAAFNLYRNYDGNGSAFGNISVQAETSDVENSSVYASVFDRENEELHLIVLNKNLEQPLQADVAIDSDRRFISGNVYGFDQSAPEIRKPLPSIGSRTINFSIRYRR